MLDGRSVVEARYLLKRVTTLDTVNVAANAIIPSFEDHRAVGLGQFLTRADLAKLEGLTLGDIMARMHGTLIMHGQGYTWLASTRGIRTVGGAVPVNRQDRLRGAKTACYARSTWIK